MSLYDFFGVGLIVLGLWLSAVASALAEASRSGIEARTSVRAAQSSSEVRSCLRARGTSVGLLGTHLAPRGDLR